MFQRQPERGNGSGAPCQAILRGSEGLYLAGDPRHNLGGLAGAMADWEYVYPDEPWLPTRLLVRHA